MKAAVDGGRRRVTVTAGGRRLDVSVAADVPVAVLAVELADALGLGPSGVPSLVPAAGEALDPDATLEGLGLRSGAVLALRPSGHPDLRHPALDPGDELARIVEDARAAPQAEEVVVGCMLLGILSAVGGLAATLAASDPGATSLCVGASSAAGVGLAAVLAGALAARTDQARDPTVRGAWIAGGLLGLVATALASGLAAVLGAEPAVAAVALTAAAVLASSAEPGLVARVRGLMIGDDPAEEIGPGARPEIGPRTLDDVAREVDRLEGSLLVLLTAQAVAAVVAGALLGSLGAVGLLAVVSASCVHGARIVRWHGRALVVAQAAPSALGLAAAIVAAGVVCLAGRPGAPEPGVVLAVTAAAAAVAVACGLTRWWRLRIARLAGIVGGLLLAPLLAACVLIALRHPGAGA